MILKEKAQELVEKYAYHLWFDGVCDYDKAKQCALITVDEILRSHHNLYGVNNKQVKFYSEVQQEIEKL